MRGRDCGDVGVVGRWVSRSFVGSAFMGVGGVASGRGKAGIAIQTMKKNIPIKKKTMQRREYRYRNQKQASEGGWMKGKGVVTLNYRLVASLGLRLTLSSLKVNLVGFTPVASPGSSSSLSSTGLLPLPLPLLGLPCTTFLGRITLDPFLLEEFRGNSNFGVHPSLGSKSGWSAGRRERAAAVGERL